MSVPGTLPRLHVVTDDDVLGGSGWPEVAAAVLGEGGAAVALHVRGPRTSGRRLHELVSALAEPASAAGALLVVNDRVDVALAAGLSAVQLGTRSLSADEARALLGPSSVVGVSCHSLEEAQRAASEGADWIFAGTVFPTPSHPDAEGRGTGWVGSVVRAAGATPVLGIGGIGPGRARDVRGAGAHGVAVMRGIWDASDPARAVRDYIEALND